MISATPGGSRLKFLRNRCGKTQLEVELDANLGIGYLQRLERGKVRYPDRDTLDRILTALDVRFIERRELLGLFGYTAAVTPPHEAEIQWAITLFQTETQQTNIPSYLLDCSSHRLLACNPMVGKLFGAVNSGSAAMLMPRLLFDPSYGITPLILNPDPFFSAQIRILRFEQERYGDQDGNGGFIEDMRQYPLFDVYWSKDQQADDGQIPMRPTAALHLASGRESMQFRLIAETFVQDPRFRVIHYLPADPRTMQQCLQWMS